MSLRWLIPTMAMVLALAHWHVAMGDNPTHSHDGVWKHSGRKHAAHNQVSPNVELSKAQETEPRSRPCTIEELLPVQTETELAPEWSTELVTDFPFNCTCPFYRARYYCPHEDGEGYPIWVPRSVAHGICDQVPFPALLEAPFPPTWKVLFYGNSHMRQVLESTMCTFHQTVLRKRITLEERDVVVPGFTQCRACSNEAMGLGKLLVDHDCMSEVENNCKCSDDRGQFFFQNEAMVHYYFSNGGKKSFETALNQHEVMSLSFYDVIIANTGNGAPMDTEYLLKSAQVMHDAGVQLIWLDLYDGRGNIADWEEDERARFADSGAKFLPIEYMVRGLDQYRKGDVEPQVNPSDPHYCLPGPPTEIGLLLLQLVWATYEERESLINRKA